MRWRGGQMRYATPWQTPRQLLAIGVALLAACAIVLLGTLPARADNPAPTSVRVTRIALQNAYDAYLPMSETNSEPYDLVAALEAGTASPTNPALKRAQTIEVTVEATVQADGVDPVSRIEVVDESGAVVATAAFAQKQVAGSPVDYTYMATARTLDADPTQPLPEGPLGVRVVFKDTEGAQLETTEPTLQISGDDRFYQLFGAAVKAFDEGGTQVRKAYADGSLRLDRTEPTLAGITVSRDEEGWTAADDWSVANDARGKSGTATIAVGTAELKMDASASSVVLVDLDDETHPETTVDLSWDDMAGKLAFALPDGHWDLRYRLVDAAGNVGSAGTYANVQVDGTKPEVSYTFRGQPLTEEQQSSATIRSDQGGQVVITVRDPHFDLDHEQTKVFVHITTAEPEFSFTYHKGTWASPSPGVYTYAVDFDYEGTFLLVLNGMDSFGNLAVSSLGVTIDGAPPTVTVQTIDDADTEVGSYDTIASPISAEVFDQHVRVRYTIVDHWIDVTNSTIALWGSNATGVVSLGSFLGMAEYASLDCKLQTVDFTTTGGQWNIVFDVVYPYDRAYYTPVVTVSDGTHEPVVARPSAADFLLIDTKVPTLAASISEAPAGDGTSYLLGTTASGNDIPNGARNPSDGTNNVWFYRSGETATITMAITETCGIKSLELSDPSGRYTTSADLESIRTAGNGSFPNSTTFATFALADPLAEGIDFSSAVLVRVTDFADHAAMWTLANGLALPGGELLSPATLLVEDDTDPAITITQGIESKAAADAAGGKAAYVRYFNETKTLDVDVADRTIKYLRGFEAGAEGDEDGDIADRYQGLDPLRPVLTIVKDGDTAHPQLVTMAELTSAGNGEDYSLSRDFDTDGEYQVSIEATDVVGNTASEDGTTNEGLATFVIDKTAPVIDVSYDNTDAHHGSYYAAPRTATIEVVEHNFDKDLFDVQWTFAEHAVGAAEPTMSWDDSATDTHTCTISFPSDGTYTLTVAGVDKAGNVAVQADDTEGYDSGTFVIDTERPVIARYYDHGTAPAASFDADDPVVEFPVPSGTYAGTNYYAHAISLEAKVKDRTIDASDLAQALKLKVTRNGTEGERAVSWGRVPDERGANGYEQWQTTVELYDDGEYLTPHVTAVDLADNTADNHGETKKFVVDLNPPDLAVAIDHIPAARGISGNSGDPVNFYNAITTLSFSVSDEHLLRSVKIVDPDSNYTVVPATTNAEGKKSVKFSIVLKDGTAAHDADYQRDIVLTAVDLAGNQRTWTIDHNGTILKDEQVGGAWTQVASSVPNVDLDGEHPLALVQDTVAPQVSLAGVTAGSYYNTAQTVVATVNELNLDWLKQFDPSRVIVTVTKFEGNASRARSSWTVPASSFTGSKPTYRFSQLFSSDGHYLVEAQFRDYATNLSNKATIGEFTIDMTAPTIQIEFDNNDVRNGKYYKAARTATITVTEHNFDPALIDIDTDGAIGGWSSTGDTHVCTVSFGEGGPYHLKVGGKDLAGNAAQEVTTEEFIVDLTAPEVTIAGTAQRLGVVDGMGAIRSGAYHDTLEDKNAYNGVVVPVITYKDNEVLSSDDLSFSLTGSKHGEDTVFQAQTSPEDKEMTISFADLGYTGEGAADGSNWTDFYVSDYDADADDIYTLSAKLTDQAGNEAEAELTFSVNRFGSNYDVRLQGLSDEERDEYQSSGILWESPTIVVREINVSGVGEGGQQRVEKEFANVTSAIKRAKGDGLGYALSTIEGDAQANGWSEYVYTIRSANFGEGSDSDHDDRGQGVYRVNVTSDDASGNANTTAEFWSSDARRTEVTAAGATAQFVLDELGPTIEDLDVPAKLSRGQTYEASFHVNDDITSGNVVEVYVDGRLLGASRVQGPANGAGTYTFSIEGRPFNWARSVRVVVRDYAGREATVSNGIWFWQSTFLLEAGVVVMALAAVGIVAYGVLRRLAAAEPELPV